MTQKGAREVVFLQDFVDVDRPLAEVRPRFCGEGGWLAPLASAAGDDGRTLLVRIGPASPSMATHNVRIRLGTCLSRDQGVVVAMRWEAAGLRPLFPVLDGDLELAPLGPDRSRVVLRASYRPPFGQLGLLMDSSLLHRVAESTVRSFLQRVASSLERGEEAGAGRDEQVD